MDKEEINLLLEERAAMQMQTLVRLAKKILGRDVGWTEEDLLQPQDFPELENSPHFRYEEGILHGILIAKTTLASGKSLVF